MDFDQTRDASEDERQDGPAQTLEGELEHKLGEEFARLEADSVAVRRRKAKVAAALFDDDAPVETVKIGRFTVLRRLGAGGMGVVYVAYDEQLDRRVAVKLLRGPASVEARLNLAREAKTMASLSHPNVVTVHEVGDHEGQIFIAMEFVDGRDLRAWLNVGERDWREIVATFAQAGHGLAAAHEAGIVHRDFKPDNVLVGDDGRVRVADFGLAYKHGPTPPPGSEDGISQRLHTMATQVGAIVGTPAYMAPEQYEMARVDERSDQFAFCVALWEGLYGQRPFVGRNLADLSAAICEGRLQPPPTEHEVPPWLHAVVSRGLATTPEARWPSMRALLDVLAVDPQARRRRLLRLGVATSLAALAIVVLGAIAARETGANDRQRYWNTLTGSLLELERERGLAQALDDAVRARDATRVSASRRYLPALDAVDHQDPMVAAALLREVEGPAGNSEVWISMANDVLGRPQSRAVLHGHHNLVTKLAFAPDGATLYSASSDGEVWRWTAATGRGERLFADPDHAEITGMALSPDGATLVFVAKDGAAHRWSGPRGVEVLARFEAELTHVGFSPDGERVLISGKDKRARSLSLRGGPEVAFVGHSGRAVRKASFSPSGARVLTAASDQTLRLWRASDGAPLAVLTGHDKAVFFAEFVDEDTVVSGADDGAVLLWRLHDDALVESELLGRHEAPITALAVAGPRVAAAAVDGSVGLAWLDGRAPWRVVDRHPKQVWALGFAAGGEVLVSGSYDASVRLHDVAGVDVRASITALGHRESIHGLAVAADGRWLATGAWDGEVRLWDLARRPASQPLLGHTDSVISVDLDRSGTRAVTASYDGSVRLWDAVEGRALARFDGGEVGINDATLSPDGTLVAAVTNKRVISLWSVADGRQRNLIGHTRLIRRLRFDSAGRQLASVASDGTARIWSVEPGPALEPDQVEEPRLILEGHEGPVFAVDFGREEIATAGEDGSVRLWDSQTGESLAVLTGHQGPVTVLVRSPDGRTLASASQDGSVRLWSGSDGKRAIVLVAGDDPVNAVGFDRSGARLVAAGSDGSARVWSSRDGSLLMTLGGYRCTLWGAGFVADDRLLTICGDGSVRLWWLDRDNPSSILLSGHDDAVVDFALSPDGGRALTASMDGSARIWRLDQLSFDRLTLRRELEHINLYCLSGEARMRELGEGALEAEQTWVRCEQGRDGR